MAVSSYSTSNGESRANGYSNHSNGVTGANGHSTHTNGVNGANGHSNYTHSSAREENHTTPQEPIAIVGMACRFGGDVNSPSQLWDLCAAGKDGWSPIPESRFDIKGLYHKDKTRMGRCHVEGGYFMNQDVAVFDAAFFNLASDVATGLDPQCRLLLETVYEATEDAGIPIKKLAGTNTSVYTGTFNKDYHEIQTKDAESLPLTFLAGTGTAMLSNRVSHFFDLQGPSLSLDTGCSAAIAAVHQGCQSIRLGESNISIIGASSTILNQDAFISASTIGAVGADGKCYAWDNRANGYGRGEGVAAIILKPLSDALRDRDNIHAVIRDTGLNQDGKTTTITSPSMDAQVKLIRECYKRAGYNIADTGYVEAHMTGTAAGDPVEAEAIAKTFGASRDAEDPIIVGSVKTNVGHTEPVSGLAAIIKTVYALKNEQIPPNLNFKVANPEIPVDDWHMQVPLKLTPWPKDKLLRASINNFGYGGTNGHAILEPAPKRARLTYSNGANSSESDDQWRVYVLSAKDSVACENMMRQFADHITKSSPSADDLAYTLSERRSAHPWVSAIPARSVAEFADRLREPLRKPTNSSRLPRLGFVFNGQGAQWFAMGRELISAYPVFGQAIEDAGKFLNEYGADWDLKEELMRDASSTRVSETRLSQATSVAVQICLVDLLRSWGIYPTAITSHSSGEIPAAYTAGLLTFKEALGVAYYRGEVAHKFSKSSPLAGGMLAVGLGQEAAEKYIRDSNNSERLVVACDNSPSSVTISGDLEAIDDVAAKLEADGVFARKLKVPVAYHSHHMLPLAQEYTDLLESILPPTPHTERWNDAVFSSSVSGGIATVPKMFTPRHWVRNMTSPVLFTQSLDAMCFSSPDSKAVNVDMILEVGAHSTLAGPIRQVLKARDVTLPYASCLKRPHNAVETMQEMACDLLSAGYPVKLQEVNFAHGSQQVQFVTDLPSYPWNHATRFWTEPRVSKEQRFKKFPPHELLGSPINGSNDFTPTWRNFIRLGEKEWLRDHQIEGTTVFPGAGYIVSAIEAVRLITEASGEHIRGYQLRDIDIMKALVIPESVFGTETHFSLEKCSDLELDHDGWYQFKFRSLAGSGWVENCKGYVAALTGDAVNVATTRQQKAPEISAYFDSNEIATPVDIEALFAGMRERGTYHGPIFRNLIDSHVAGDRAITNFKVGDIACIEHEYLLHPTTLDSIMQTSSPILPKDVDKDAMVLPRSIGYMRIPRDLKHLPGEKLRAFTELVKAGSRGYSSNITVTGLEDTNSFFEMRDFFGQAVPKQADSNESELEICSKSVFELDILHDVPKKIRDSMLTPIEEHEAKEQRDLLRAAYYFIQDALKELDGQDDSAYEWHFKRFIEWMNMVFEKGKRGELGAGSSSWQRAGRGLRKMLIDELRASNAAGRLTVRVGENLAKIIRGELPPFELMMEGGLLNQFYADHEPLRRLKEIVELYAIKNPGANVLEVGAGTGSATITMLEGFSTRGDGTGSILGHYTFTDISAGFFEAAKEKFAAWSSLMEYQKLDIEIDPVEQGFTPNSYDLIVAASCLHATKNLHTTMSHVRKLLKPGGKLLLVEVTADRLAGQLIFGTLPGWWLGEEPERYMSPNAPLEVWDRVLRETGHTGVEFEVPDWSESEFHSASVIMSSAATTVKGPFSILLRERDSAPKTWLAQLSKAVQEQTGSSPTIEYIQDFTPDPNTTYVTTLEMERPYVDGMSAGEFENIKSLLISCYNVLWLSTGGIIDAQEPTFSATEGLLRTIRQEDSSKRCIRLDFERNPEPWTADKIPHIIHVLKQSFDADIVTADLEREYYLKDDMLHVLRLYPNKSHDIVARDLNIAPEPTMEPFQQAAKPLVWEPPAPGTAGTNLNPHFIIDEEIANSDIPSGMVEIEAKAFGLNFREVLVQLGQLGQPLRGHECSGIVTALGPDTQDSGLAVGDRVCALVRGPIASRGRTYWTSVAKLPDTLDISWEEAASIPAAYTTAYSCLMNIARLQKGETVLIHAATGATGQAAIVLAQHVGARVFATCSSETKRDLLVQQFGLDADDILSSRDASFAPALMAKTGGKGVDVVFNSLSGPLLKASWNCIVAYGRFVDITKLDMEAGRQLDTKPFTRSASYTGFDLVSLTDHNGRLTQEALVQSLAIRLERNKPAVYPITPFSITDIDKAMRQMQGGTHIGKLVLVPGEGDLVRVVTHRKPVTLDNPDATYLIAGGMTGIGLATAQWMLRKGVKNLLLVSRHATTHPAAEKIKEDAREAGCRVELRDCDISNEASFVKLLESCSSELPPIRGVVNGAMVLDDTVFERMTYEQWRNGIGPKIDSSHNIHKHLPNLSFFVMLSSAAGVVGHMSQSNYAAGNTYQDALARYRTARGQPAVTIDLSAVQSVGYVADKSAGGDERLKARVEYTGLSTIDIEAVLRLVEDAIREPLRPSLYESQVIVGPNYLGITNESPMRGDRRFGTLRIASKYGLKDATGGDSKNSTAALVAALSKPSVTVEQATDLLVEAIAARLADIFNLPLTDIDVDLPLSRYGVDSLVAVELRNWLSTGIKSKVSVFEILQSASLTDFAALVARKSELIQGTEDGAQNGATGGEEAPANGGS